MTSSSTSTTADDTLSEGNPSEFNKKNKSRAAQYSDEERLKLIEEVYKRRVLWDVERRDAVCVSPAIRKQAFSEVASIISTEVSNKTLKAEDIERQWKNLKDTYVKIRKKHPVENGTSSTFPKWRFYRLLKFIDSDEHVTKSFDFGKELIAIQNEQCKPNKSKQSNTSSASTNTSIPITQLNSNGTAILSNGLATPNSSHHQIHVNLLNTSGPQLPNQQINSSSRLKRPSDTQFTYVRHVQPPTSFNHIDKPLIQTSNKESRLSSTPMNGIITNGLNVAPEDEYVTFCKSLISPIREIATYSRMEYVKLQKIIHDALYEIQTRIHSEPER